MVGWNEDYAFGIYTPYRDESIHAFLQVLSELIPIDAIEERLDDDPCLVNVNAALKALGTDGDGLFDSAYRRKPVRRLRLLPVLRCAMGCNYR